ncbi:hypothetical protein R70006_06300 [Paraburkholderia domus]|nr:hypothetical protein R70006_06300 [Paraburkholderia domus]
MVSISLATALGLRPLDRIQINNRRTINELWFDQRTTGSGELPFLFFQRVLADGQIEARHAGGCAVSIDPLGICDILPAEPVKVRAMPESVFLQRLKVVRGERRCPPGPECFHAASVLFVSKDRWGGLETYVWFDDVALNTTGKPWMAPIHTDDRELVRQKARRTCMPVQNRLNASAYSADAGCTREADYSRAIAAGFIATSLRGQSESAQTLASVAGGVKPLKDGVAKLSKALNNKGADWPPRGCGDVQRVRQNGGSSRTWVSQ